MTDRIALVLALVILAAIGADVVFNHATVMIFLGRRMTALIDFLQFWR